MIVALHSLEQLPSLAADFFYVPCQIFRYNTAMKLHLASAELTKEKGFLRNFVFGAEDSLVSTVGLLSGISFAGLEARIVIVSGVILILVEAISMAAGTYLAEDSTNDLAVVDGDKDNQLADSIVMFFSYLVIGLVPLLPYMAVTEAKNAFFWSVAFSLVGLFLVGMVKGIYVHKHPIVSGLKITGVGAVVIAIAVGVGWLIKL